MNDKPDPLLWRIMESYRRAWETRDAGLVASLFTEEGTYQADPFDEPFAGHAAIQRYWQEATGRHQDIRFRWRPVHSAGSQHVVEWKAEFTRTDAGRRIELRGVMLLELDGERIARFREYWHRREKS